MAFLASLKSMSVMGGPCISDRSCLSSHSCRSARAMMETPWLMSCDALTCASTAGVSCLDERRRSEEHTSELQSQSNLVCRLLLEKKKKITVPKLLEGKITHLIARIALIN